MNSIRQIQELNKQELKNGVSPEASWHTDYRDTAYIYVGGLPFELSEGDIITIFSQYGEPTFVNLVRDKDTGKSKGFAFLKYEDQRSTDLAVDNLGGTTIMGRMLKVDHTRYKKKDEEPEDGVDSKPAANSEENGANPFHRDPDRPMIQEERELAVLIRDHNEDDPMKAFLIEQKNEEIAAALALLKDGRLSEKDHKKRHHHRRLHLSRDKDDRAKDRQRSHHHRDQKDEKLSRRTSRDRSIERYSEDRTTRDRDRPRKHS